MKFQSKDMERELQRRIYDDAKTPWQRFLLSGVLPDEIEQKWRKDVEALDPLRLVQHVEALQRAVWRCAEGGSGKTLMHFSLDACVSAAQVSQREALNVLALVAPDPASVRDWSLSMNDPFLGGWEQIHAYMRARPTASAGEVLQEWQRRFPERFVDAHLSLLQRRLREIRASLVASQAKLGGGQMDGATTCRVSSEPPPEREDPSPLADVPAVVLPDPVGASLFLSSTPETGRCLGGVNRQSFARVLLTKQSTRNIPFSFSSCSAARSGEWEAFCSLGCSRGKGPGALYFL